MALLAVTDLKEQKCSRVGRTTREWRGKKKMKNRNEENGGKKPLPFAQEGEEVSRVS